MFADRLSGFAAVDLPTLIAAAPPQRRRDRKYLLDADRAGDLLNGLAGEAAALDIDGVREFGYVSTYFDTRDLASFESSAKRRRRRFKVRTRVYGGTGERWLEVKTVGARGHTIKDRTPLSADWDGDWLDATLAARSVRTADSRRLAPVLTVRYLRSTLLLSDASRATVDTAIAWTPHGRNGARRASGLVIVETKTPGGASPADRWLWRRSVRPARISKYATGMALLDPSLDPNRWRRTLDILSEMEHGNEEHAQTRIRPRSASHGGDPHRMLGGLAVLG